MTRQALRARFRSHDSSAPSAESASPAPRAGPYQGLTLPYAPRAHSSAGERSLHTREVPGSIPGAPILEPARLLASRPTALIAWPHLGHGCGDFVDVLVHWHAAGGLQKDGVVLDQWGDAVRAAATASSRELTPRARKRRRMWFRTVSVLRWSSAAICFVERPCSRRRSTSTWRGVRWGGGAVGSCRRGVPRSARRRRPPVHRS